MPSAKILEAKKALVKDLNEKIVSSLAGVSAAARDLGEQPALRAPNGR